MPRGARAHSAGGRIRTVGLPCGTTFRKPHDVLMTFVDTHCRVCESCAASRADLRRQLGTPMGAHGMNATSVRGGVPYGPEGIVVAHSTDGGAFRSSTLQAPSTGAAVYARQMATIRAREAAAAPAPAPAPAAAAAAPAAAAPAEAERARQKLARATGAAAYARQMAAIRAREEEEAAAPALAEAERARKKRARKSAQKQRAKAAAAAGAAAQ
jgi:pyruvate/2-oxoglutarate dehydrogenase complex dihydrolipoamide acyltransferase (E2) component